MMDNGGHMEETRAYSPLLAETPREMPHRVPEGYFGSLSERMMELVRFHEEEGKAAETAREEIERLSPLLATAFGNNPYKTHTDAAHPTFDTPPAMEARTQPPPSPLRRLPRPHWTSYAAAAVATGIIAFLILEPSRYRGADGLADKQEIEAVGDQKEASPASGQEGLTAYMDEQVDAILITAEATDTMMMKDALLILDPGMEAEENLFDDIPSKELYAFIEQVPDLSGLRPDME